jgi:glycine cleavage system H protein
MIPTDLKYCKTHEWIRQEGDVATIGITDYGAGQLGDIVFVELPAIGKELVRGQAFGAIESVKAAVEITTPASGMVIEINKPVVTDFSAISQDAYEKGWLIKIRIENQIELEDLMDGSQYERFLETGETGEPDKANCP